MKKLIIILIAPILLVSSCAFGQNSDSKKWPEFFKYYEGHDFIFGNVKEIHYEIYDAVEQDDKIVLSGRIISNDWFGTYCTYFFNTEGQVIRLNATRLSGDWTGIFNYQNGILSNIFWLNNDTLKARYDYTHPTDGKLIRTDFYIQNDNIYLTTYYDLDLNGFMLKRIIKDANGVQVGNSWEFKRDNDGRIVDKNAVSPEGKTMNYELFIYDEKGRFQMAHRKIKNGEKVDFYGATNTYEYDDKGNWIKRTSVFPNNNIRITVRKFVFY